MKRIAILVLTAAAEVGRQYSDRAPGDLLGV